MSPSGISVEPAIRLIWYSFGSLTSTILIASPRSSRRLRSTDVISAALFTANASGAAGATPQNCS